MRSLRRLAAISAFLLRYRHSPAFGASQSSRTGEQADAAEFVRRLEQLGPLFIKLGQMLAGRYGEIPQAYLTELARLQDHSAVEPFEDILAAIEVELGTAWRDVFSTIDPEPIGSASLAQVHAARLHSGREVALKVQRPRVAARVHEDLDALRGLLRASSALQPSASELGVRDWLDEFAVSTEAELDYLQEAGNLAAFAQHLAAFPNLWVPSPVWECCTPRLLTMDLLHGIRVDRIPDVRRLGARLDLLAEELGGAFLEQVMLHGFIHADLHAGNVLLTEADQLAIFDVGMVGFIPPRMRSQLHRLVDGGLRGRGEAVAETYAHLCSRLERYDEPRFQQDVSRLVGRYALDAGRTRREGEFVLDLVAIGARRGLRPPAEIAMLGKALLTVEGVVRSLAPHRSLRNLLDVRLPEIALRRSEEMLGLRGATSPWSELADAGELVRHAPRRLSQVLHTLAENRLKVRVLGLGDPTVVEGVQKVANRISAGLIAASLVVAAAVITHAHAGPTVAGYPILALSMIAVATTIGLTLMMGSWLRDRRAGPKVDKDPL